jgi:hypothetical protein
MNRINTLQTSAVIVACSREKKIFSFLSAESTEWPPAVCDGACFDAWVLTRPPLAQQEGEDFLFCQQIQPNGHRLYAMVLSATLGC